MIELNKTVLVQLVNFFVMIFFLNHFLFKPILKVVENRKKKLRSLASENMKFDDRADKAIREHDTKMAELKNEVSGIISAARKQANQEHEKIVNRSREEFTNQVETAKQEIEKKSAAVFETLKKETEKISRGIAGKIMGREIV
ncbi:MAG: ATP synthase subunit b [bacterium]|nr:MAG: ATP synthase subunit b [bacterium]